MSQCGARRKTQRGRGYGFGGTIGTNGAAWSANNTSRVGGRRKSKKARRKTRGGGSAASVGYGYAGTGVRGLGNVTAYNANPLGPSGFMGK